MYLKVGQYKISRVHVFPLTILDTNMYADCISVLSGSVSVGAFARHYLRHVVPAGRGVGPLPTRDTEPGLTRDYRGRREVAQQ